MLKMCYVAAGTLCSCHIECDLKVEKNANEKCIHFLQSTIGKIKWPQKYHILEILKKNMCQKYVIDIKIA